MEDSWFFPIFQATRNSLRQSPSQPTTVLQKIRNVTTINKQNLSPSELLNTPGFTFLYLFKMQSKGRENTAGNNKENCPMHGKLCCKKVILTASSIAPAFPVVLKIHPGKHLQPGNILLEKRQLSSVYQWLLRSGVFWRNIISTSCRDESLRSQTWISNVFHTCGSVFTWACLSANTFPTEILNT